MQSVEPKTKPDLCLGPAPRRAHWALRSRLTLNEPARRSVSIAVPYATASLSASSASGAQGRQISARHSGLDELAGGTAGLHSGQSTELDEISAARAGQSRENHQAPEPEPLPGARARADCCRADCCSSSACGCADCRAVCTARRPSTTVFALAAAGQPLRPCGGQVRPAAAGQPLWPSAAPATTGRDRLPHAALQALARLRRHALPDDGPRPPVQVRARRARAAAARGGLRAAARGEEAAAAAAAVVAAGRCYADAEGSRFMICM